MYVTYNIVQGPRKLAEPPLLTDTSQQQPPSSLTWPLHVAEIEVLLVKWTGFSILVPGQCKINVDAGIYLSHKIDFHSFSLFPASVQQGRVLTLNSTSTHCHAYQKYTMQKPQSRDTLDGVCILDVTQFLSGTAPYTVGLRLLCQHNFQHNRHIWTCGIMPA